MKLELNLKLDEWCELVNMLRDRIGPYHNSPRDKILMKIKDQITEGSDYR